MPLAGGRVGTRQRSSILSYQDRIAILPAATYTSPLLNTIGFSRVSVAITQRTGAHTGSYRIFGVVGSFTESGITPFGALRFIRTIVIGAISAPEVADFHWGFRMLQLLIDAPPYADIADYDFDLNVYGTSAS